MPNTVKVGVEADTKKAEKNVKGFTSSVDGLGAVAKKAGAVFAGVFAAKKLLDFGVAAVTASAKAEGLKTQLETLTGSADSANKIFQELIEFSASTPFQIGGITNTTKKLLSFGFAQEEIIEKLKDLGDVAAGSGADLEELGLIFGQVRAAGKLTGERFLQLQERAIPIGPAIAKTMGVAENSVRKMVSEGRVSFQIFEKAFSSLSEEGNQFAGGMVRQSQTFNGVISTLSDNAEIFAAAVGDKLLPVIKKIAIASTEALKAMTAFLSPPKSNISVPDTLKEIEVQLDRVKRKADIAFDNLGDPNLGKQFQDQLIRFQEEIEALEAAKASLVSAQPNPKDDPRVQLEQGVIAEIKAIREEAQILEQEQEILLREAQDEKREGDIARLGEFELRKIEITRTANLEKAKLIQDEQKRASEIAKINAKTDLKRRQTELKQTRAHEKQLTNIKKIRKQCPSGRFKGEFYFGSGPCQRRLQNSVCHSTGICYRLQYYFQFAGIGPGPWLLLRGRPLPFLWPPRSRSQGP